jgi:predicted transcriptional regulator
VNATEEKYMTDENAAPDLRLGAGELELLEVLWRLGAVTIAEAQAGLDREQGYTTVQTRLERLVAKGVAAKSKNRPARYSAAVSREEISRDDLKTLVRRVTQGSVVPLIAHLVNDRALTSDEVQQIRDLITQAETRSAGRRSGRKSNG